MRCSYYEDIYIRFMFDEMFHKILLLTHKNILLFHYNIPVFALIWMHVVCFCSLCCVWYIFLVLYCGLYKFFFLFCTQTWCVWQVRCDLYYQHTVTWLGKSGIVRNDTFFVISSKLIANLLSASFLEEFIKAFVYNYGLMFLFHVCTQHCTRC